MRNIFKGHKFQLSIFPLSLLSLATSHKFSVSISLHWPSDSHSHLFCMFPLSIHRNQVIFSPLLHTFSRAPKCLACNRALNPHCKNVIIKGTSVYPPCTPCHNTKSKNHKNKVSAFLLPDLPPPLSFGIFNKIH